MDWIFLRLFIYVAAVAATVRYGTSCPISHFHRHPCLWIAGVLRKSLRTITIELQVHLTLSALQAPAYIMSDSGTNLLICKKANIYHKINYFVWGLLLDFSLVIQLSTDTDVCGSQIWNKEVPYLTVAVIIITYMKSLRNIHLNLLASNTVCSIGIRLYYVVRHTLLFLKYLPEFKRPSIYYPWLH